MRVRIAACALAVATAALSSEAALAALIPRSESGSIEFVEGPPTGLAAPLEVREGAVAWSEELRPRLNVRLLEAEPPGQPGDVPGIAVGTIMFGYQLSTGVAYCPRIDGNAPVPVVQCLRDFDDDGQFDALYISADVRSKSSVLIGRLHQLSAAPRRRYEAVSPELASPVKAAMIFEGYRGGKPAFRMRIEESTMKTLQICEPVAGGACDVDGLRLKVTKLDQTTRIELLAVSPDRNASVAIETFAP